MTIVVLGIDALDAKTVQTFSNLELSQSSEIETFSHMRDTPYTLEVWPTVATGKMPNSHGITGSGTSNWDSIFIDFLSRFTGSLPEGQRGELGRIVEKYTGNEYNISETEKETLFDHSNRLVHDWPGVRNNEYLLKVWKTLKPQEGGKSDTEFQREVKGVASEQFGWVEEMINHDLDLVATHIHTIDVCGHVYCDNKEKYQDIYSWVDRKVGDILHEMSEEDELVILSDHGMEVEWESEDTDPGGHSWRAFASTTLDKELFDHVADFRGWIEPEIEDIEEQDSENIKYDEEQLRDLGYIE